MSHFFSAVSSAGRAHWWDLERCMVAESGDRLSVSTEHGGFDVVGPEATRLRERLDHLAAVEDAVMADQQREGCAGEALDAQLRDWSHLDERLREQWQGCNALVHPCHSGLFEGRSEVAHIIANLGPAVTDAERMAALYEHLTSTLTGSDSPHEE